MAHVADGVRSAIRSLEFGEGDRLPAESVLAEMYGVSRPTVRAALRELEVGGLVQTRHGVGSFVVERPAVEVGLERLDSISESIRAIGKEPGMVFKARVVRPLLPDEAEKLGVPGDTQALELRRTILADNVVVAFSYDLLPIGVFPEGADPESIQGSLFEYLRNERGMHPHHAVAEVHAVQSDHIGWESPKVRPELYVLLDQVHFDSADRALMYSRTYFLEGRYTFSIQRTV